MPETSILFFGLTSIKCAVKLRQNTSEQTDMVETYEKKNLLKHILFLFCNGVILKWCLQFSDNFLYGLLFLNNL